MKTYKSAMPEIILKMKKGEVVKSKIKSSNDADELFRKIWDTDSITIYETMICIFLNRSNNTIGWLKVSQGGISGTIMDVRLILSTALNCLASGLIIAHNHPSGNLEPSESDKKITKKLKESGEIMDIQLHDHIILAEDNYFSFADEGLI